MRLNRSYFLFEIFIITHILTIIGKDVYYAWYHPELLEEYARADQSIFGSLFTLLFLYMIKYKQEGYRYNAILLLVLEIYICTTKLLALSGPLYQLTTIGLLLVYVADIVLHPIHKLQHEQDRYQVGLKQMQLNDSSKTELSIWYPCKKGRQGEGKWITQPSKRRAGRPSHSRARAFPSTRFVESTAMNSCVAPDTSLPPQEEAAGLERCLFFRTTASPSLLCRRLHGAALAIVQGGKQATQAGHSSAPASVQGLPVVF